MVASTAPVDKNISHGEGHSSTPAAVAVPASHAVLPSGNVWNARKEAMKPSTEADAEKRVESIIENIKEVTLGKSYSFFFGWYEGGLGTSVQWKILS
jgi:hypothetical protein